MAALPDARCAFGARLFSLGFAVAAAAGLSGCGAQYASSDPAFPGDFHERHPIVLASAPTSIDIFPVGGALDTRSIENIRAFAQRYRHYGSGDVALLAVAGPPPIRVLFVRSARRSPGPVSAAESCWEPTHRPTGARRRRFVFPSSVCRRPYRRPAVNGPTTSLRGRRSKGGRTSRTRTSAARANRCSPPRSTTRAISSSRGRSGHPTSPCAPEPSRPSATATIPAPSGRTLCWSRSALRLAAEGSDR
jgi:hypothetical protein